MLNPQDVLTKEGYQDWLLTLRQLDQSLFTIVNNADDLHIGARDQRQIEVFYEMQRLLDSGVLKTGDSEIQPSS